ncbi:hypothetical protein J6590_105181 [Homalodisca vitripennis]|nr:hypothetical protein J6590_105181 [Homalodisca vitripennis]
MTINPGYWILQRIILNNEIKSVPTLLQLQMYLSVSVGSDACNPGYWMLQRIILNNEIKSVPTPLQLQRWLDEFSLLKDSGNFLEEENCSPVNRIVHDNVYDPTIQPRRVM